jgi:hypothetical protein
LAFTAARRASSAAVVSPDAVSSWFFMLWAGYTASGTLVIPRPGQDYSAMSKTAEPSLQNAPLLLREDRPGGICVLTLNRPAARNSLSRAMLQALED